MINCKENYGQEEFDKFIPDQEILENPSIEYVDKVELDSLNIISGIKRKRHFIDNFLIHKDTGALCFPLYYDYNEGVHDYINNEICIKIFKKFKKIWFGSCFNKPIDFLPDNIEELRLGVGFSKPLNKLPSRLKYLYLHSSISLDNLSIVPENLYLGGNFNLTINNLPEGIKKIYIDSKIFNLPIDNLPNTIEEIYISGIFEQPLDNLPNCLKKLTINCNNYSNNLTNLPINLEILEILNKFTGSLKILNNIKSLKLYDFEKSIENLLNEGLEELYFQDNFNQPLNDGEKSFLPSTLKKLSIKSSMYNTSRFNQNLDFLPDGLEELELDLAENYSFDINTLPHTLKVLKIVKHGYINQKVFTIKELPPNIINLKLDMDVEYCIPKIPNSCKNLTCNLSTKYGPFELPTSIEHLELYKVFHSNVVDDEYLRIIKGYIFPLTLVNLSIPYIDCRQISLPCGLKILVLNDFGCISYLIDLPDTIEYLHTGYIEFIDKLPNNLIKFDTHIVNKELIDKIYGSSNKNVEFKYAGKLERQYAYSPVFSFM